MRKRSTGHSQMMQLSEFRNLIYFLFVFGLSLKPPSG
jgi:hypothetical protein